MIYLHKVEPFCFEFFRLCFVEGERERESTRMGGIIGADAKEVGEGGLSKTALHNRR